MSYSLLTLEQREHHAVLTINRPDKLNALNDALIGELARAADEIRNDSAMRGVIITGAGRAFVAGADISELATQTASEGKARAERGQAAFALLENMPKPVIAAVNGFALGGGCELALACHIRIASEAAQFGQPEVKLGITPGYGGSQRLPRLVGNSNALEMLLTGDRINAAEALRIGLVNKVVPADQLMAVAEDLMKRILANGPLAVALCIEAVRRGAAAALDDALALEASHFGLLSATDDMREGMRAFLEKRPAVFTGK
jgi:enoyl-CoA hydratase